MRSRIVVVESEVEERDGQREKVVERGPVAGRRGRDGKGNRGADWGDATVEGVARDRVDGGSHPGRERERLMQDLESFVRVETGDGRAVLELDSGVREVRSLLRRRKGTRAAYGFAKF